MKIRIRHSLYEEVLKDLRRPHRFAAERVGFLTSKIGNTGGRSILILTDYIAVPDTQYIRDYSVGARINTEAIRAAKQRILDTKYGLFHVHLHDLSGLPTLGLTDRREIPPIIESFRNVGLNSAHGILLLSSNKAIAIVWPPGEREPKKAEKIVVVGNPLLFLEISDA
jgi:hypothetical protein